MNLKKIARWSIAGFVSIASLALVAGCASKATTTTAVTTTMTSATPTLSPTATPTKTTTSAPVTTTTTQNAGYTNPDLLVSTAWLSQHLNDGTIKIVDARTAAQYQAGHIKGAVSLPVADTFNLKGPAQMAGPADRLASVLGERGITRETRVIVYDNGKETTAARVLWTLALSGNTKSAVLDGGFKKWQGESLSVDNAETVAAPATYTPVMNSSVNVDQAQVLAAVNKPGVAIVDARSPQEYTGQDLRAKRGGHMPGAVNIDWTTLLTSDAVPVLKSPAELQKMFLDAGVTKDKQVIVHCQTGQRSSVTYLVLKLLGYTNVQNYDGSWQEWGNDPNTPIVQ